MEDTESTEMGDGGDSHTEARGKGREDIPLISLSRGNAGRADTGVRPYKRIFLFLCVPCVPWFLLFLCPCGSV